MNEQQKQYGKLTANDLRLLLSYLPIIDKEQTEMNQLVAEHSADIFTENTPRFYWCNHYEKTFPQHSAEVAAAYGIQDEILEISKSERPVSKIQDFIDGLSDEESIEQDILTPEQIMQGIPYILALNSSIVFSMRSLMVFGRYLNELIAIARDGAPSERDKALLQAVRIDKTVVGCPTAMGRISCAVMMDDVGFMNSLRKAMFGKFDYQKNKNYQKIRYVLQVMLETGASDLSDKKLKELFVKELNLYSDSQFTAEKNLGEYARNFKNKKSTI